MELYFKTRNEWHKWLEENSLKYQEVWLVYYKKPSGKPRIPYNDAVEEALCFGWIDGKIKRINEEYYIQRFTPRRQGSRWSKYNVERVERLKKQGLMRPSGLKAYQEAIDKPELLYNNNSDGDPTIPDDLLVNLVKNKKSNTNFLNFPPSARRTYIEWLNSAKRADTRLRRIEKIILLAEKNQRPGMI